MPIKEEDIKRILSGLAKYEGVESVVLADDTGFPLSSTISPKKAETISALVTSLIGKVKSILEELELSSLKVLVMRTADREILVTPQEGANLVVVRKLTK
ncbi:MAG: roadblock/LC7 domain-containing protein [Candidatus Odinarchaeota archaeon]|nr:roadblock/LC7 domain-containing protein [Candidatus Odinarchaeota archaeon]